MIQGTVQTTGPFAPTSTGDTFPTHIDIYCKGGLMNVDDETQRNDIPYLRRTLGMIVGLSGDTYWKLNTNPTGDTTSSSDWILFSNGSVSGDTFWADGSSGTDSIKADNNSGLDATGDYAVAEGYDTHASGSTSHAEGYQTTAQGDYSHSEGDRTIASGPTSHAEGRQTTANGNYSHAEGIQTTAIGAYTHAEGNDTHASGYTSHAEGHLTKAFGDKSHAEGWATTTNATASHAEGYNTTTSANYSHVGGSYNILTSDATNSAIMGGNSITGTSANTLYAGYINLNTSGGTPAASGTTGENGTIRWDEDYAYLKTGKGWGRIVLDYEF